MFVIATMTFNLPSGFVIAKAAKDNFVFAKTFRKNYMVHRNKKYGWAMFYNNTHFHIENGQIVK